MGTGPGGGPAILGRTFLGQFLPEVEPQLLLALLLGTALGFGCLLAHPLTPPPALPRAGSRNTPKFNREVLVMLVLGCLWLFNPRLLGESNCVPVQFLWSTAAR